MAKNLSCVSHGSLKRFPHTFTNVRHPVYYGTPIVQFVNFGIQDSKLRYCSDKVSFYRLQSSLADVEAVEKLASKKKWKRREEKRLSSKQKEKEEG